jgi:hypothetical protein
MSSGIFAVDPAIILLDLFANGARLYVTKGTAMRFTGNKYLATVELILLDIDGDKVTIHTNGGGLTEAQDKADDQREMFYPQATVIERNTQWRKL